MVPLKMDPLGISKRHEMIRIAIFPLVCSEQKVLIVSLEAGVNDSCGSMHKGSTTFSLCEVKCTMSFIDRLFDRLADGWMDGWIVDF